MTNHLPIGLGNANAAITVYIANRPPLAMYLSLSEITPLTQGEISAIGQQCGNGWRKVFNVYSKLLFSLDQNLFGFQQQATTWQAYRDKYLLQPGSPTALMFSPPILKPSENTIHIIMGRTYAKNLVNTNQLNIPLVWLDNEFAINEQHRVIVCPYFDYRQLSNIKIERLALLIKQLTNPQSLCPQCQQDNQCGALVKEGGAANEQPQCWCFDIKLAAKKPEKMLDSTENRCICRKCLAPYII